MKQSAASGFRQEALETRPLRGRAAKFIAIPFVQTLRNHGEVKL
jgi:hypothetical protein